MNKIKNIGRGGLGIVSLWQELDGQYYAVKEMLNKWDSKHYERFKREIQIMSNLVHKNIIRIINYDAQNNNPWYVMPYYREGNLRDKMRINQIYSSDAASGIIYCLADALSYAHGRGVVHRDLKPENILFNGREPIVADWGVGKFIHVESQVMPYRGVGTQPYCAPEQWNSGNADARSDIYSLGLIYRELITGSITGYIHDVRLRIIIDKMTNLNPSARYQTMEEVKQAIQSLNIVRIDNPMANFWKGVAAVGGILAGIYFLSKLFGD